MSDASYHVKLPYVEPGDEAAVLAGVAGHLGCSCDEVTLAKARAVEDYADPRYPALYELIKRARRDWAAYGEQLVAEVMRLLDDGKLLPMTERRERLLVELLEDHQVALVARITGRVPPGGEPSWARLHRQGLVDDAMLERAPLVLSWKAGRRLEGLGVHRHDAREVEAVLRSAMAYQPTEQDQQALRYVQRRGAVYMRRPAAAVGDEVSRVLSETEAHLVRGAIGKSVALGEGRQKLKQRLSDAVQGHPTLTNNMDRVARTELAFAHNHGAYQSLREELEGAGLDDPEVYKFCSPRACKHCRRIWGNGGEIRYKLSYIEAREAAGGNFGLKAHEWGPVIGPVHPNCTEGPLQVYHPDVADAIDEAFEEYERLHLGR